MGDDRRKRRGDDFGEHEMTIPSSQRREPPRIATPVGPDLKPGPAQVARRAGSVGAPPVETPKPFPAVTFPPGLSPGGNGGSGSAVPVPVIPERSSRSVAPASAPNPVVAERSNRHVVGPIVEKVRDAGERVKDPGERHAERAARELERHREPVEAPAPRRDSSPNPPVLSPAQQALHAARALSQSAQLETVVNARATIASSPPLQSSGMVRVHRLPPPAQIDERLFMLRAPDSKASASFRVLRHRLGERSGLKTILVTSPDAGEGKTLCAANLALALCEAGRARVLLLEANFRRPRIAELLGFRPPICFAEQLDLHRAQPMQGWAVVENLSPWLHTAAVGTEARERPMLDGPTLSMCLEQLRGAGYDYIVLDSPPILGSADVNLIEESVDGILVAMWARRSRSRSLRRAVEQVGSAKILGVALLGI